MAPRVEGKRKRADVAGSGRSSAREALLEAAGDLMAERKTLDISLNDIAARAKANSALVKYYFGSKQGMLLALLQREMAGAIAQIEHLVEVNATATEKMRVHIAGLINLYYRKRFVNELLFSLLRQSTPEMSKLISDQIVKPAAEAQRKILEQGIAAGEFIPVDPTLFYFTVVGACHQIFAGSFALQAVFDEEGLTESLRRRFIDHTTAIILTGIKAP